MGYLPEALMNYLLRLGWSHGDEEIISTEQAIQWFDFDHVGKSPARFDLQKLENLNGHYIRESSNESLVDLIVPILESELGKVLTSEARDLLLRGMEGLKQRAKTIVELAQSSGFYVYAQPIPLNEKAQAILTTEAKALIGKFVKAILERSPRWNHEALLEFARGFAEQEGIKLKDLAQPLRAAITGSNVSPGVFEVMEVLGQEKSLERLSL
ncbi:MAG: hypothetical protein HOI80_05900 [Alphaproteobacteria bacterium]|nr:hypothetical protein [Alphaproteobacteria bacterium]